MRPAYDLAIVGSGFAGSLLSMIAMRLGYSVVLLEKDRHPRFAVGESSTPFANLLLEQLANEYNLPSVAPLAKWGTWQAKYPHLSCGLKRGFSFFHHRSGHSFQNDESHRDQCLVAASPHDHIADTHWFRSEFDEFLAGQAQAAGVDFFEQVQLHDASEAGDEMRLSGTRLGQAMDVRARFVVDATGPRGFLHQALGLQEVPLPGYPDTQALYTHFADVRRFEDCADLGMGQPFAVDDAALHHVFEDGWIWVLRFNNGLTSAGISALDGRANRLRLADGPPAWCRVLKEFPSIAAQFAHAEPVRPFIHGRKVAFRSGQITGNPWALLPSTAGFVDPLLSTGIPLTLLGVGRLASILKSGIEGKDFTEGLNHYAKQTDAELLSASSLIGALFRNMADFQSFSDLSLLYFAAASYTETVHRLGRSQLATSFLLGDHPTFGPAARRLYQRSGSLRDEVLAAIEPINVAGLGDAKRRNWYPVDAEDLFSSAAKVGSNHEEVAALLDRSGFWSPCLA